MRLFCIIILSLTLSLAASAQENKVLRSTVEPISTAQHETCDDDTNDDRFLNGMVPVGTIDYGLAPQDSLHLPALDNMGRVYGAQSWRYPWIGSFGLWDIHEGLNVQLGLSAFTSFRNDGFNGWGQNISAVYAKPLNDHLSIAVGGYFNNLSTGMGPFRSAGLTAVLNYRFNDHWDAFIYAQKGFYDNHNAMFSRYGQYGFGPYGYGYGPLYDMGMFGDRIGAGVTWHPNQSTSVQVQFEVQSDPRPSFHNRVQDRWEMPDNKK